MSLVPIDVVHCVRGIDQNSGIIRLSFGVSPELSRADGRSCTGQSAAMSPEAGEPYAGGHDGPHRLDPARRGKTERDCERAQQAWRFEVEGVAGSGSWVARRHRPSADRSARHLVALSRYPTLHLIRKGPFGSDG